MATTRFPWRSQRILILGIGAFAQALAKEIIAHPSGGISVIGLVSESDDSTALACPYPIIGSMSELSRVVQATKPDRIIVALSDSGVSNVCQCLIEEKFSRHIIIDDGEEIYEHLTGKLSIENLSHRTLVFSRDFQPPASSQYFNRVLSFVCALLGLILLSPLILLIALLVKMDSPGPVLFVQERMGLANQSFRLMKFRSMHQTSQKTSEWACDNEARITRMGRLLRKYRLDELPQFVNILRGEMNLVGPRPHPASNYEMYVLVARNLPASGQQTPYYALRSLVKPGITGWAQVKYHYANNLGEEMEKLRFDLYYIKNYSVWLDLRILAQTVKVVLLGHEQRQEPMALSETIHPHPRGVNTAL